MPRKFNGFDKSKGRMAESESRRRKGAFSLPSIQRRELGLTGWQAASQCEAADNRNQFKPGAIDGEQRAAFDRSRRSFHCQRPQVHQSGSSQTWQPV